MKSMNKVKMGLVTLTALSSALVAMDASAACGGSASITLNKAVLATMTGDSNEENPSKIGDFARSLE